MTRRILLPAAIITIILGACASQQNVAISALHHFHRGNDAFQLENYAGAIHHYLLALAMDNTSADFHYNLGLAYYRIDEFESSVESFENALALDPKRPDVHYNLALAHHKRYDIDSANLHFNRYRAISRSDPILTKDRTARRSAAPNSAGSLQPAARQAQPNRRENMTAAKPAGRNRPTSSPNPFDGNSKWWMEDLPAQ